MIKIWPAVKKLPPRQGGWLQRGQHASICFGHARSVLTVRRRLSQAQQKIFHTFGSFEIRFRLRTPLFVYIDHRMHVLEGF